MQNNINLEIIGKFYDNHSLSIVNRYLAIELSKYNNVVISPIDSFTSEAKLSQKTLQSLENLLPKEETAVVPDIQIRHSYPPIWRWPHSNDTKVVYIQPWEFTKVPFEWQYKFETFADALITFTRWTGAVYQEGGINPERLFCIPIGYDPNIFYVDRDTFKRIKYTFLFVGCDQYRKGFDILLQAWANTFKKEDNVELIVKDTPQVYGKTSLQEQLIKLQYTNNLAKITYIDDPYSEKDMADLYRSVDVLVHPYRGEGFGMPVQEAIACGTIPLVTGGGCTDEFVTDYKIKSSQKIVDINNIFAGKPGDSFNLMGSHTWLLEPEVQDLISKMKMLYDSKKHAIPKSSKIKNWEEAGIMYNHALKKIHDYPRIKRVHGN
jgi:glycosyltransferase involved in cell wall biosynthesis